MSTTETTFRFTTEEAVAFLRKAPTGAEFRVYIHLDAPLADDPDRVFPDCLSGSVRLGRREAMDLVSGMLTSTLEARGGRIPLRVSEYEMCGKKYWTCWIG